jgi:hypothetical protein
MCPNQRSKAASVGLVPWEDRGQPFMAERGLHDTTAISRERELIASRH